MAPQFPRGIEVLIKKASVDSKFKKRLFADRAAAARAIGLELAANEAAMLAAVPDDQLERIIAQTTVPEEYRRVFMGKVAEVMLAVLEAMDGDQAFPDIVVTGIRPDAGKREERTRGTRPDIPS